LEDKNNNQATLQENRRFRRANLPRPYPDPEQYDTNLALALSSDPRRKTNYDLFLESSKTLLVEHLPVKMDVENVSRCNFRCTMCQVSDWGPNYQRAQDMSFDDFKALVDEQYGLIELKLQGMGEPLLARDEFFKMIRYARSKNIWVRTTTNASLLHFKDNYKHLIDSGINEVQISFDGATKETFEKIRVGSNFDLVVKNCKLVNDYCDEQDLLRTRMWVVVQQGNVAQMLDFVQLASDMGFKRLTFSLELTDWGQSRWSDTNNKVTAEDDVSPESAEKAIEKGRELGVEVTYWDITEKYSTKSVDTLCQWPFQRAYVSSDMRIVPCCTIANPEVSDLGDARNFTEVWNSETYQEFRKAHLEGRIPEPCKICYMNESVNVSVEIGSAHGVKP
jgi:radical SAM protein with 4Fe4S-binding SPASM domain